MRSASDFGYGPLMKWFTRWRQRKQVDARNQAFRDTAPDPPLFVTRSKLLEWRLGGRITMGQYHSAIQILDQLDHDIISKGQAEAAWLRLFPLSDGPSDEAA